MKTIASTMTVTFFALALAGCGSDTPAGDIDAGNTGGVQPTFTSLYGDYLSNCAQCHSPSGPGRTSDIEMTLDFSTKSSAYTSLKGMASGLMGNFTDCNGVAFLAASPGASLLVASLDQATRQTFDVPATPNCNVDTISDQTVKVGSAPSADFIAALKTWVTNGAPNN